MQNNNKVPIAKALNEELKQGLYIVLEPEVVDAHGDIISELEIRKACHNFNQSLAQANLFHLLPTTSFSIVESYISPVEMQVGEQIIKAGTWLANLQFTDTLWEAAKTGKFSGVSIGALGIREEIEE